MKTKLPEWLKPNWEHVQVTEGQFGGCLTLHHQSFPSKENHIADTSFQCDHLRASNGITYCKIRIYFNHICALNGGNYWGL